MCQELSSGGLQVKKLRNKAAITTIAMCAYIALACSKSNYEAIDKDDIDGAGIPPTIFDQKAKCEIEYWDQSIDINLYSYEFVDSNNMTLGFKAGGIIDFLGLNVVINKARLYMDILPSNPYEKEKSFLAHANDNDVKFGMNVDFSQIGMGFENYSNTPVAKLTRVGLMNSIEGLRDKVFSLNKYKREWSTRVLYSPIEQRDRVIIQAGADAGITEGDEFEVFNIEHSWMGQPCQSTYWGFEPTNGWDKPDAILKATRSVDSARQFASLTIADPRVNNQEILPGAYVRQVPAKKGKKLKTLSRSIKVNSITSGDLVLKNGKKVDLVGYMRRQINDVLQDKKWKGQFYMFEPRK